MQKKGTNVVTGKLYKVFNMNRYVQQWHHIAGVVGKGRNMSIKKNPAELSVLQF